MRPAWGRAGQMVAGAGLLATIAGLTLGSPMAVAAHAAKGLLPSTPPVAKEVLVLERSTTNPSLVVVFEEVTLKTPAASPWPVPLPYNVSGVRPQSAGVRLRAGAYYAPKGTDLASVAYSLPGTLGSVFAQNLAVPNGQLAVLAGNGVYPGVGTGLTLHGQAQVGGKTFVVFAGAASGPTNSVHFSLTAGHPGRPWSDALDVALVLWVALGAYAGMRFLVGPMTRTHSRTPGHDAA